MTRIEASEEEVTEACLYVLDDFFSEVLLLHVWVWRVGLVDIVDGVMLRGCLESGGQGMAGVSWQRCTLLAGSA